MSANPKPSAEARRAGEIERIIEEFIQTNVIPEAYVPQTEIQAPPKANRLQMRSVRNILLVSSLYDSFIFEEGGGLTDALYTEYAALGLIRPPPHVTRVSALKDALSIISSSLDTHQQSNNVDLIICFLRRAAGMDIWQFLQNLKEIAPRVPVLLLASNTRELSTLDPRIDNALRVNVHKTTGWEAATKGVENIWAWPFLWQGDFSLIFSMIKTVEDRLNLRNDVGDGNVRYILVVEDNVQFYSAYLPMIYRLIFKLSADVMKDSPNTRSRMEDRLRRPKIMLANSYEEAVDIYTKFQKYILGVITDVGFYKSGNHDETAGLDLTKLVRSKTPHVPVLVQSSESANEKRALELGASFLLKSDRYLLSGLRAFLEISVGFGPFVFRDPDFKMDAKTDLADTVVAEAPTVLDVIKVFPTLKEEVIKFHSDRGHFQIWFAAHNRFKLADEAERIRLAKLSARETKQQLLNVLTAWRKRSQAAIVTEFRPDIFLSDLENIGCVQKLGTGSLGGKGHGLAFLNSVLENYHIRSIFPQLTISVPQSLILATGLFDQFMEDNDLQTIALSNDTNDEDLKKAFLEAKLSEDLIKSLGVYLSVAKHPLAIRSSSVFEDAMDKPYAGIYDTHMIPNNHQDAEVRLAHLQKAIKLVYASTFKKSAQAYAQSVGTRVEEAKMAVVIQQVAGHTHENNRHFPSLAGVAGSYDVYAKAGSSPKSGYCTIAAGLGATVVEGAYAVRFSPGNPKDSILVAEQHDFLALDMKSGDLIDPVSFPLTKDLTVFDVPKNFGIRRVPSGKKSSKTVDAIADVHGTSEQISAVGLQIDNTLPLLPSQLGNGTTHSENQDQKKEEKGAVSRIELVDLAKTNAIALSQILTLLLQVGSAAMSCPIEMEFAIDFQKNAKTGEVNVNFALLQMRALAGAIKQFVPKLELNQVTSPEYTLVYSNQALGHIHSNDIRDVVYVSKEGLNLEHTPQVAQQIGLITARLHKEKRPYILIGPGRWGTATPNLGIPVTWQQIHGAACIVETPLGKGPNRPSQGTHFFQNITAFEIPYFTVDNASGSSDVNHKYLEGVDKGKVASEGCVKHISFDTPLQVVVDGVSRCGVIMLPGHNYQTLLGQANAFLELADLPCY